jgi:hypothetical protein
MPAATARPRPSKHADADGHACHHDGQEHVGEHDATLSVCQGVVGKGGLGQSQVFLGRRRGRGRGGGSTPGNDLAQNPQRGVHHVKLEDPNAAHCVDKGNNVPSRPKQNTVTTVSRESWRSCTEYMQMMRAQIMASKAAATEYSTRTSLATNTRSSLVMVSLMREMPRREASLKELSLLPSRTPTSIQPQGSRRHAHAGGMKNKQQKMTCHRVFFCSNPFFLYAKCRVSEQTKRTFFKKWG